MPGKFTTTRGWSDPFRIIEKEDPEQRFIASILAQASVEPLYSGASIVLQTGEIVTEGLHGSGEAFMQGTAMAEALPGNIVADVNRLHEDATELGPIRLEWVHDGERAWVVQMHRGATVSAAGVLVPGNAEQWTPFEVSKGLEELRSLIAKLEPGHGIDLHGEVGLTSHIADVIRKANVPARMRFLDHKAV
jgi:hypothetical protein